MERSTRIASAAISARRSLIWPTGSGHLRGALARCPQGDRRTDPGCRGRSAVRRAASATPFEHMSRSGPKRAFPSEARRFGSWMQDAIKPRASILSNGASAIARRPYGSVSRHGSAGLRRYRRTSSALTSGAARASAAAASASSLAIVRWRASNVTVHEVPGGRLLSIPFDPRSTLSSTTSAPTRRPLSGPGSSATHGSPSTSRRLRPPG